MADYRCDADAAGKAQNGALLGWALRYGKSSLRMADGQQIPLIYFGQFRRKAIGRSDLGRQTYIVLVRRGGYAVIFFSVSYLHPQILPGFIVKCFL